MRISNAKLVGRERLETLVDRGAREEKRQQLSFVVAGGRRQ